MSINRFNARRDQNEPEIIAAFESRGIKVHRLDTPLDLLLGYNKHNYLVEVKMPNKKLNKNQVKFTNSWKGQYFICWDVGQAQMFADEIVRKG